MAETLHAPGADGDVEAAEADASEADAPEAEAAAAEAPDAEGPDAEGPDAEGPDAEGPDAEGPDAEGPDAVDAADAQGERSNSEELLVQEGDIAGDYLERLLDLLDFDGDIDLDVEAGRAIVSIDGGEDLSRLVGQRGEVLESLQELTRLAVQQETGVRSRLMLDVAQWRAKRRQELHELGRATAEKVLAAQKSSRLQPMTPFERKVVHDAVAEVEGAHSESEGEEPQRRVVVFPSS